MTKICNSFSRAFSDDDMMKKFYDTCGKAISFKNWNTNEPNNSPDPEDCGQMYAKHGRWTDRHCDKKWGFICKFQVPRCEYLTC